MVDSPALAKHLATLHLAEAQKAQRENFGVLWLDAQHGLIAWDNLFLGTLTQTSVYPREVLRAGLRHDAAACVLAHNHPSGSTKPSRADELLTKTLKDALALVDIRVLDHLVVGDGTQVASFAELGLL
jgi:DNA repair protein RadC